MGYGMNLPPLLQMAADQDNEIHNAARLQNCSYFTTKHPTEQP